MKARIALALTTLVAPIAMAQSSEESRERYAFQVAEKYLELVTLKAEARQDGVHCEYYKFEILSDIGKMLETIYEDDTRAYFNGELRKNVALQEEMGDSLRFRQLVGYTSENFPHEGLENALIGVTMNGPAPGVFGNISRLEFLDADTVKVSHMTFDEEDSFAPRWESKEESYKVTRSDRQVFVVIGEDRYILSPYMNLEGRSPFAPEWNMVPAERPDANPYMEGFVDLESECEA